jgi:hypothetical protein
MQLGCAIAQAVSRRLATEAARVRSQVRSYGFVVDEVALGKVFPEYFGCLANSHPTNCSIFINHTISNAV